jgi:hypothetical protein
VSAGKLMNAPLVVGVQTGSRQEKLTVDSGRSKGAGVATGLGDGLELSLGDGLALALDRGDGLGGAAV